MTCILNASWIFDKETLYKLISRCMDHKPFTLMTTWGLSWERGFKGRRFGLCYCQEGETIYNMFGTCLERAMSDEKGLIFKRSWPLSVLSVISTYIFRSFVFCSNFFTLLFSFNKALPLRIFLVSAVVIQRGRFKQRHALADTKHTGW